MKKKIMFLGERVTLFGKIYQCFRDEDGEAIHFTGLRGLWFGSVYLLEDNKISTRPKAIESDWEPTTAERVAYEAQKCAVLAKRQSNRKALKIKRPHDDLVSAIGLVKPFYLSMNEVDRRRFMDWFSNECSKRSKKKGRRPRG